VIPEAAASPKIDPLLLAERERLRAKILAKFGGDLFLAPHAAGFQCDSLALEQATAPDIARWKAAFWPPGCALHDLCCGMGADSFFVPASVRALGVDIDPARVRWYGANLALLGLPHQALLGDAVDFAEDSAPRADFFCIDPARRPRLAPGFDQVLRIAERYGGGMAKLPPAFPVEEIPPGTERVYLGGRADCRETLVLFGSLAREPGRVRAVEFEGGAVREWQGRGEDTLPVAPAGAFLLEPSPVLVRSHLFLEAGRALGLWQIDSTLSYLSCDTLPPGLEGFSAYQILARSGLSTREVKAMLKAHDIGSLTLKKRGVSVVPEDEIRRLKPQGAAPGVLFYTRCLGQKTAYLARHL
jgi:hypothetical protein